MSIPTTSQYFCVNRLAIWALEGLLNHGQLQVLALFDKPDPLDGPYFEETFYVTPSRLAPDVQAGVADVVADVVSTGATLRQAGLAVIGEPILRSSAVLVRRTGAPTNGQVDQLVRRLHGVLVARQYVMLAYDVRADLLEKATALTPGIESPTISPLRDPEWVAVRVMSPRKGVNQVMDALYAMGARAILVTEIHAARL